MGEENTNTTQQQKDFAQVFYYNEPYQHHIVIHTPWPERPSLRSSSGQRGGVDGGPEAGAVGERIGWTADGEWLEYTVDVTAGTYYASLRYSFGSNGAVGSLKALFGDGPDGTNFFDGTGPVDNGDLVIWKTAYGSTPEFNTQENGEVVSDSHFLLLQRSVSTAVQVAALNSNVASPAAVAPLSSPADAVEVVASPPVMKRCKFVRLSRLTVQSPNLTIRSASLTSEVVFNYLI